MNLAVGGGVAQAKGRKKKAQHQLRPGEDPNYPKPPEKNRNNS